MYVLLEGGGIFWAGQNKYQLSPGGVALLPRNVPHALRITAPSDMLAICTPAGIERFFEAIGSDPLNPSRKDGLLHHPRSRQRPWKSPASACSGRRLQSTISCLRLPQSQDVSRDARAWSSTSARPRSAPEA
jgi:hypothetical protein